MGMDRRAFLQLLTTGAASAAFPASIARALEIPANDATGTIRDVEHVIFLMQENRSFDHYFGTLRGVRGFNDPRVVRLASGEPVWRQPDGDGYVLPFRPPAPESNEAGLGLTFLQDLAHDWTTTHQAWNEGRYDNWVPSKGAVTMAHLTRGDIPFHYALADAFTVCDAYYCSLLGPTDPNRYHMWSGWVGNDGKDGGPAVGNEESGYSWATYPERLQKAGVSWKVYQDAGVGLDAKGKWGQAENAYVGNYGDNALLYFLQYERAEEGSPLYTGAKTGTQLANGNSVANSETLFEIFAADVRTGKLPQVSWVVAPEAYSEHPNWAANYGAWYVSQILDALTANPKVWNKTALFLMFDENDGFFDHMVPPTPPLTRMHGFSSVETMHEIFPGNETYPRGPYGLGVRVPMIVISPWSRGGWVNSEVFDHTSMIRFLERRFGVEEPNITPWRRAVTGDLTSAFDFERANAGTLRLPSTVTYCPPNSNRYPDYKPAPPAVQQMPVQEPGTRPARPLPYALEVDAHVDREKHAIELTFHNSGATGAVFHVRASDGEGGPWSYTVGARHELKDTLPGDERGYELSIYGPNGFYRVVEGRYDATDVVVTAKHAIVTSEDGRLYGSITLTLRNDGEAARELTIHEGYIRKEHRLRVASGETKEHRAVLKESSGWYDLLVRVEGDAKFRRHFAGHVETGRDSLSDPMMGRV